MRTRLTVVLTGALTIAGAILGAGIGLVLSIMQDAAWHAAHPIGVTSGPTFLAHAIVFGALGAVLLPVLGWTLLRRAPIWRVGIDIVLGSLAGGAVALVLAPALLPLLVPLGMVGAAWRLHHEAPRARTLPLAR